MSVLLGVVVFVSAIALDYADASNTRAVAEGRPHAAARWSIMMYLLGLLGFCSVLKVSLWLAIPEAAGLYVGTLLAVPHAACRTSTMSRASRSSLSAI